MISAATWMDPKIVRLSDLSQRKVNIIGFIQNLKKWHTWTYLRNLNRVTESQMQNIIYGSRTGGGYKLGNWD